MSTKEYVDEIAPDVAAKLASDLHSSADENLISSMLAACLNESEEFMKWFCSKQTKLFHGNTAFRKLWATANDRIPEVVTSQVEPPCTYRRPDIVVWNREGEDNWRDAERGDNDQKKKAAMRDVDAIFVEVKKTHITDKEQKKYEGFVQCLSRVWRGSERCVGFVIVSSHDSSVAKRIRNGDLRHRSAYTAGQRRWVRLFRYSHGGTRAVHITLGEIFKELNENKEYRRYRMLPLFKSYLALYTAQVDDTSYRKSWKHLIRLYQDDYAGLRKEIIEFIRWMAVTAGIGLERRKNLEERMRVANLVTIKEQSGGEYRLSLSDEARDEVPGDELHVKIRKAGRRIRFRLCDGSADSIADNMQKVRDRFDDLRRY